MAAKKSASAKLDGTAAPPQTVIDFARFPEENPNPVLRVGVDGSLVYANSPGTRLLETLGWRAGRKLPSALRKQIRSAAAAALAEFDLAAGDRLYSVAAIHEPAGRDVNLYLRDVTYRRQAEEETRRLNAELAQRVAEQTLQIRGAYEAVKAERQRLYQVLETLPVYVVLLSPDYHVPFANRFFRERFGDSDGRPCYEYLFERTEPCEDCETFKVLKTGAPHHWEWTGPDGCNYDIYDFPFTDSDGSSLIMEMGIDVTEVHRARAALEEVNRTLEQRVAERTATLAKANERLRTEVAERLNAEAALVREKEDWARTFDSVPDLIALLDNRHHIVRVNRAMARTLDVEPDQCIGLPCFECVHGAEGPPDFCPHACTLADGRAHTAEVHEDRLGGDFLVTTTPIFDPAGELIGSVHVARDIAERRRAELALRELNETLEQRVAERTAMAERRARHLRRMATELSQAEHRERNRLAAMLHDDLQQLLLAARLHLAAINGGDDRQRLRSEVEAVDRLLDECMSASRDLTMELSPPILRRGTLGEVIRWLGRWFGEKHGLSVVVDVPEEIPPTREDVRVFLFQATRELLLNTVKHSGKTEARVSLFVDDGCLGVRVEDSGTCFDPEAVRQKLERANSFGLLSVRERVEALEGSMEFETTPAGGACFRLVVPVLPAAASLPKKVSIASAAAGEAAATGPVTEAGAIRLLIVDDHKVVREGFVGLLDSEPDLEVVGQAADGEEAIRQAEALRPEVIVMDVEMPTVDGIEATRRIKQQWPGILVVGLSLHEEESVARAIREAGASVHLSKNGPAEDLIRAIRRTCGRA